MHTRIPHHPACHYPCLVFEFCLDTPRMEMVGLGGGGGGGGHGHHLPVGKQKRWKWIPEALTLCGFRQVLLRKEQSPSTAHI